MADQEIVRNNLRSLNAYLKELNERYAAYETHRAQAMSDLNRADQELSSLKAIIQKVQESIGQHLLLTEGSGSPDS